MSPLLAKETGSNVEPVAEGIYAGTAYLLADLGRQRSERFGTEKRQVVIGFELPEVRITGERDGEKFDLPRAVSRRFTLSLHEGGNLRPFLEAWRGRRFTPTELSGFDLRGVLGVPAMIQVIHETKADGKTIAKIANVMPLAKGMQKPKPENEKQYFSFDDCPPGQPVQIPEELPEWIRDAIQASRDFREPATVTPAPATAGAGTGATAPAGPAADAPAEDDNLPF